MGADITGRRDFNSDDLKTKWVLSVNAAELVCYILYPLFLLGIVIFGLNNG